MDGECSPFYQTKNVGVDLINLACNYVIIILLAPKLHVPHLHSASIFISISSPVEQPLNRQVHLPAAIIKTTPSHSAQTLDDL